MILCIDGFTIMGTADELVSFIRAYSPTPTTVSTDINTTDWIVEYQGKDLEGKSIKELQELLLECVPDAAKTWDVVSLTREELIDIITHHVKTTIGNLQNN